MPRGARIAARLPRAPPPTAPPPLLLCLALALALALAPRAASAAPYAYRSYAEMHRRLAALAQQHPRLLRMYSAQQTFLLPHVGTCSHFASASDAADTPTPCTVWVVELSNLDTLPADPHRPEMLVSGLVHGDEVVGPHAVVAFIEYMVSRYDTDAFVKRLVDSRLVTLIPTTNAVGFFRGQRGELQTVGNVSVSIDPNRDFAFDQDPAKCMQTVTARVINELFRMHLFRVLVTFHGGTNVLGYEWGDTAHCDGAVCKPAPDTAIMHALADRMSTFAGPAGAHEMAYPIGDMGKLVYSVKGGMEDWAYGASWSGQGVTCTPSTLGGYPKEKTKPEASQKRCITYLVETSRAKKPEERELGDSDNPMQKGGPGDGHVPRNVRLLLAAMDSLSPYIMLHSAATVDHENKPVVSWTVGGAFLVDGTALQWSTVDGGQTGLGEVLNGTAGVKQVGGSGGLFKTTLTGDLRSVTGPVYIRIAAVVDQRFAQQPNGSVPDVTPQSHLMGSRASSKWDFSVKGHNVKGHQVFFSPTRELSRSPSGGFVLSDVKDVNWASRSKPDSDLFHALVQKHKEPTSGIGSNIQPTQGYAGSGRPLTIISGTAGVLLIVSIAVAIYICARKKRNNRTRTDKARSSFALMDDDEEEEERKALTLCDEELGNSDGQEEGVLSASGVRTSQVAGH